MFLKPGAQPVARTEDCLKSAHVQMRHGWPLNWYRYWYRLDEDRRREKRAIVICKWYADTKPAQCQQILKKPCWALLCVCVRVFVLMVVGCGIKISYANCESLRLIEPKTPKTSLVLFVFGALQTSPALTHDPAEPSLEISPWVEFLSRFHAKDDLPFSFPFFSFCFPSFFCACVCGFLVGFKRDFCSLILMQIGFFLYKLIEIWRYCELEKLSGFYNKVNEIY